MSSNQTFSHGEDAHSLFEKRSFVRLYLCFQTIKLQGKDGAQVPKESRDEKQCILAIFFCGCVFAYEYVAWVTVCILVSLRVDLNPKL